MIYIHIPFCRSFCTYCGFYSELAARCSRSEDAAAQDEVFEGFTRALCREISLRGKDVTDDCNTLYIGGGTPSVLPLSVYERILKALEEEGCGGPFDEFTVEVNPEDVVEKGEDYVEGLLRLGVNRISMGVQSFDDKVLRFMNRRHDAATARKAYSILENAGVENISIDLIFGLPQLSDDLWQESLEGALSISESGRLPKHISSYQLSVEPESTLEHMLDKGLWHEASEEVCRRQYDMLCSALSKAGYRHYEISNFALPGYEAMHNSAYWRHIPYIGFGPGAHGMIPSAAASGGYERKWNRPDLQKYIQDPMSVRGGEDLNPEQVALEHIMLALRTAEGISEAYLLKHAEPAAVTDAISSGNLVRLKDEMVRIPEDRFFVSDSIIAGLV